MLFTIAVLIIVIGLPCAVLWWICTSLFKAIKPKKGSTAEADREKRTHSICLYFNDVERDRAFPDITASINLKQHEFVVCNQPASLYEYRTQRYSTGASVRVARGVYVGGRQQHSYESLREVATGQVIVTNQRIVYLSTQHTRTVNLSDILSIEGDHGFLEVHTSKRQKPVLLGLPSFDTALLTLLVKLFTTGKFEGRFLPSDIHLAPQCGPDGEVSVNVSSVSGVAPHLPT